MMCPECYSEYKRITPILKPEECLRTHTQYICGTCGRCICANHTDKGLQRWNFPFKTLEIAKQYLRVADIIKSKACGIYEIKKQGRVSYKIFADTRELEVYLLKHKGTSCETMKVSFQIPSFMIYPNTQIRNLNDEEIEQYLHEQRE